MKKSVITHANSIDFLLENAGPVIRYRLRKEILEDLTPGEEEHLLEQIYELPQFKLVQSCAKLGGYIGSGMHEKLADGGKREDAGGGAEPHKRHLAAGQ